MVTQSLRTKFQGPPSLRKAAPKSEATSTNALQVAQHREKDSLSLGKVALGLGLAAGALAGCTEMAPAAQTDIYLEAPEVVVLSESTQRIDLSRETDTQCVGFGASKECVTEDVAYHPVGIHLGEGIVQDMNGNLFAAPQLVADGAPGAAVESPEILEADNSYGATGILQQTSPNTYQMGGDLFGRAEISTGVNHSTVRTPGFFKAKEHLTINAGVDQAFIREHSGQVSVVKAHGDHISVHNENGDSVAQVRHNGRTGEYRVDHGFNETSLHYDKSTVTRKEDGWAVSEVSRRRDGSEWDNIETKSGPDTVLETSVYKNGWSDTHSGPYGTRTDYVHTGGTSLSQQ
jgi:hypothetical protein